MRLQALSLRLWSRGWRCRWFFKHTKTFPVPQRSDSINDPRKNTVNFVPLTPQQWYVRPRSDSNRFF